jgi:hypothetical protein
LRDRDGCQTRAKDQNQDLITCDDSHMTAAGSETLINGAARQLLGDDVARSDGKVTRR